MPNTSNSLLAIMKTIKYFLWLREISKSSIRDLNFSWFLGSFVIYFLIRYTNTIGKIMFAINTNSPKSDDTANLNESNLNTITYNKAENYISI